MKKVVIAAVLLVSSLSFAQEVKPKFEMVDQMVKATYYYDNGQVKQEGYVQDMVKVQNYLKGRKTRRVLLRRKITWKMDGL